MYSLVPLWSSLDVLLVANASIQDKANMTQACGACNPGSNPGEGIFNTLDGSESLLETTGEGISFLLLLSCSSQIKSFLYGKFLADFKGVWGNKLQKLIKQFILLIYTL